MHCIFPRVDFPVPQDVPRIVVVAGLGDVGSGPSGGQLKALSTASGPVRAPANSLY